MACLFRVVRRPFGPRDRARAMSRSTAAGFKEGGSFCSSLARILFVLPVKEMGNGMTATLSELDFTDRCSDLPRAKRTSKGPSGRSAIASGRRLVRRARRRSRTTSVIIDLTRRATTRRRGGAQFDSIGHRAAIFARPRRRTWACSPIATRLFDVHLGFRRTSVVIDLTRRATYSARRRP